MSAKLSADYSNDERVGRWVKRIVEYAQRMSYDYEHYGEADPDSDVSRKGPGLYVAFVSSSTISDIADQPNPNVWYDSEPRYVDDDGLYPELRQVAQTQDQAVVIWMNGRVHEYNVRFLPPEPERRSDVRYPDERGTRHQSAAETSIRDEIVMTLTVSEEDGTVMTFWDGAVDQTYERREIVDSFEDDE